MSEKTSVRYDDLGPDARFLLLLEFLRAEAVVATRAYRRRELHRGRQACAARNLCDDCSMDVLLCVMQVFHSYEGARNRGRRTELRRIVDAVVAGAEPGAPEVPLQLLRTLLANAGKDARRRMATGSGRDAKPEAALRRRTAFKPLRDDPLLLEVALIVTQFAQSNTALPPSLLPFDKFAEHLRSRAGALGIDPDTITVAELPLLVERSLSVVEAIDAEWLRANVTGPISERMTEFTAPDEGTLQCEDGNWGEVTGRWGVA